MSIFFATYPPGDSLLPTNPPVQNGLAFWLDATDITTLTLVSGLISAWADKSGNQFNFSQSNAGHRPAYDPSLFGGKGGAVFDFSTGGGMLSDATASTIQQGSFTYFVVGVRTDGILSAVLQDFASSRIYGPTGYANRYGIGQSGVSCLQGVPVGQSCVMGFKNTGDASTACFFNSSGVPIPILHSGSSLPTGSGTMGNLSWGGKDFGTDAGYSMQAAAVLMYNRALSNSEIVQVCTWIRIKYGISLPDFVTQNINFSGDSITSGFSSDGGVAYPEVAMSSLLINNDQYTMSAIPGQTISQINTTDTAVVDPLYNPAYGVNKNIICVMGGTNDIIASTAVATVEADMQTYCLARRAAGWKIIVSTLLPGTNVANADFNVDRDAFNVWLRANYTTFADGLADVASDPTMGPDAAASDTSLYIDGIHPTALGHSLIAPYFADAVSGIL